MTKNSEDSSLPIPGEFIEQKIFLIRGHKVMLDRDLAGIYGVETRALIQAVTRNPDRFPIDFMFQLSKDELENWRSQIVMSNPASKMGLRRPPYAFTELGVAMLSLLGSEERTRCTHEYPHHAGFLRLRAILATHTDLARAVEDLSRRQDEQGEQITAIIETINQLLLPEPEPAKRRIGFDAGEESSSEA
jgi:hypothetical protein